MVLGLGLVHERTRLEADRCCMLGFARRTFHSMLSLHRWRSSTSRARPGYSRYCRICRSQARLLARLLARGLLRCEVDKWRM